MKTHTTNYYDTFIEIAEDSTVDSAMIPPQKGDVKTIANIQFEILNKNPYKFTSDDVLFKTFAEKKDLTEAELENARKDFFSKGQPCFRASPLTKKYGWGIHSDTEGRIALVELGTDTYETLKNTEGIKSIKAMKSKK